MSLLKSFLIAVAMFAALAYQLTDQNWKDLETAGWKVNWYASGEGTRHLGLDDDGRWLGALARSASVEAQSEEAAIEQWERITGEDADAEGCECCGQPHNFYSS